MPWDPDRYLQFQKERFLPFEDLLRCIDRREGLRVVDLGCGTGELTSRLADALPGSEVLGIDSSPQMLERARTYGRDGLRFELTSLLDVDGQWDLVFSHAVIQWVDDHRTLIPRLLSLVRPGGQLAVQVPANASHPSQRFITEVAREEPFRRALNGWARDLQVLEIDEYAELLYQSGAHDLTVFSKVYPHVLQDAEAIADWLSGTALVPYFERLPEDLKERFLDRYREKLRERYSESPVFYGFKRILFAARI